MSGHSKWATIKRQKGAADIKRGLVFTKISNAITIAVRQGGGIVDPDKNFKLRLAIEIAKEANMPKENIQRAIDRAVGVDAGSVEEVIYEGFAKGGVSVIVEAVTDNPQRTSSEIKNLFAREGANLGQRGSVLYQFATKGQIVVGKKDAAMDNLLEIAADCGAEDIEDGKDADTFVVYTDPSSLSGIKDKFLEKGVEVLGIEVVRKPLIKIPITDPAQRERVLDFLERLGELDDVQKVYSNLE